VKEFQVEFYETCKIAEDFLKTLRGLLDRGAEIVSLDVSKVAGILIRKNMNIIPGYKLQKGGSDRITFGVSTIDFDQAVAITYGGIFLRYSMKI